MFQKNCPCRGQISFPYFPGINHFENTFSYHNSFLYRFVELLVTFHFAASTDSVEIQTLFHTDENTNENWSWLKNTFFFKLSD